jgi:hypothetical protein
MQQRISPGKMAKPVVFPNDIKREEQESKGEER